MAAGAAGVGRAPVIPHAQHYRTESVITWVRGFQVDQAGDQRNFMVRTIGRVIEFLLCTACFFTIAGWPVLVNGAMEYGLQAAEGIVERRGLAPARAAAQPQPAELDRLRRELRQAQADLAGARAEIDGAPGRPGLQLQRDNAVRDVERARARLEKVAELEGRVTDLTRQVQTAVQERDNAATQLREHQQKHGQEAENAQAEVTQLRLQLTNEQAARNAAALAQQQESAKANARINDLQILLEQAKKSGAEGTQELRQQLDAAEAQIRTLGEQNEALRATNSQLTEVATKTGEQFNQMKAQLTNVSTNFEDLQRKNAQTLTTLEEATNKIREWKETAAKTHQELSAEREKLNNALAEKGAMAGQVAQLKQQIKEMVSKEQLQVALQQAEQSQKQFAAAQAEAAAAKGEAAQLRKEKDGMVSKKTADAALAALRQQLEAANNKARELEQAALGAKDTDAFMADLLLAANKNTAGYTTETARQDLSKAGASKVGFVRDGITAAFAALNKEVQRLQTQSAENFDAIGIRERAVSQAYQTVVSNLEKLSEEQFATAKAAGFAAASFKPDVPARAERQVGQLPSKEDRKDSKPNASPAPDTQNTSGKAPKSAGKGGKAQPKVKA